MPSFFLTLWRLLRALRLGFKDQEFRNLFKFFALMLLSGVLFYSSVEGWSFVDAFYFSVITLSTVGYGDLAPQTDLGKIFTSIYILVGIGLFVAVASHLARQIPGSKKRD
ncbi:MAG: potassium channel family protein [Roseibium sp.]|uniref:potassium channel family protein n=1 Tax=Roseibium sp. TaxID=1936156 RepID=UPI0032994735